jgi:hypothetical protein
VFKRIQTYFAIIVDNGGVFQVCNSSTIILWAHKDTARGPREAAREVSTLTHSQVDIGNRCCTVSWQRYGSHRQQQKSEQAPHIEKSRMSGGSRGVRRVTFETKTASFLTPRPPLCIEFSTSSSKSPVGIIFTINRRITRMCGVVWPDRIFKLGCYWIKSGQGHTHAPWELVTAQDTPCE